MAATRAIAPQSNGLRPPDQVSKEIAEYEKILTIRDEIFANTHPRLKLAVQASSQEKSRPVETSLSMQAPRISNKLSEAKSPAANLSKGLHAPASQPNGMPEKPADTQGVSTSSSGASGIDPIFLTKSEVLVKAELQQKRQRVERALEEQINQKKVMARPRTFEQDVVPEFDVTDVLRKAHELVKPSKAPEVSGANGSASSDSFDENTLYSSEMNESSTQEVDRPDKSPKWRSSKPCNHFIEGQCPYGEACAFSHDPALKRRKETDRPEAMDLDTVNTDVQMNPRKHDKPQQAPASTATATVPTPDTSRIAELEEQLRILKSQHASTIKPTTINHTKDPSDDEPMYSPPDARVPSLSEQHAQGHRVVELEDDHRREPGRRPPYGQHIPAREYDRRHNVPPSVVQNDMRVIRNHITSPVAPQPARVSPLAVAKVPPLAQGPHNVDGSEDPFQGPRAEVLSARPSQNPSLQPLNSRKRRRGIDANERARNVIPRRDNASPEVRIKDEPMSPPPMPGPREVWQPPRRQEVQRPIYIDSDSPQIRDRGRVVYNHRPIDRSTEVYLPEERRPMTPVVRRIVSRAGQRFDAYDEPDLRRVVSARQVRAPLSPIEQYTVPHPASARAPSQVYLPQAGPPRDYRASVQPPPAMYIDRDRSVSPIQHTARATPFAREVIPMAPPARRIIRDEHGPRYIEAEMHPARHGSIAPVRRPSEFVPRYEEIAPHIPGVRDPQLVEAYDERHYVPRVASPTSPRYIEYTPPSRARPVIDRETGAVYSEYPYAAPNDGVRIVEYVDSQPVGRYEDAIRPREAATRMQSVRPVSGRYEIPREEVARVQSVRPEQDRIVSLGGRREMVPQPGRQMSVRAEEVYARPMGYAVEERPQYQYTDGMRERRLVEDEVPNDNDLYEAPGSANRRPLQRL